MDIISFRNWTLNVDREITQSTYDTIENGSPEDCKCTDCINYIAGRDAVFPDEIKQLFRQLGINYKKEAEIWRMYRDETGLHHYAGFFHFKGTFDGEDCAIPLQGGGANIILTPINEFFSIGFRIGNDLTSFKEKEGLVQIEFEAKISWMIDKKLESEE